MIFLLETIFNKLHIKANPNKVISVIFYIITIALVLIALSSMIGFLLGDARVYNDTSPYMFSVYFCFPVIAFSYFVNSGMAKGDHDKVISYIVTLSMLAILVGYLIVTWIDNSLWSLLEKLPNYNKVLATYPELFAPAIKTLCFVIPFVSIFKLIDYYLTILRDEDLSKSIAGFSGISALASDDNDGTFSCETVICTERATSLPVIVPEKKRYEATLVQGATGTGKTATILLPMSALDLEKKYFFREYSKKLGYSLLRKGIAYMTGPFDNDYINRNFSLKYLKPKRGMEEQFYSQVDKMIQYSDDITGEIVYKNLGVTVVENDGNYISKFRNVAKNFDIDVYSVDPADPENTLSINPFAIDDATKVASIIADVLKSMYENQGGGAPGDPFFTQVTLDAFQNLAILLKEMYPILNDGEIASLEDMLELLYNFDKVEEMTEEMKKIPELAQKYRLLINYFEKNFYKPSLNINGYEIPGTKGSGRKDTEKFLYGAITQLNNLIRNPGLKKALCGKSNILNFDRALEDGSVITACSRKGELGVIQSKAFGMFFILQFQDAIIRRKGNEDSRIPHFLYIDEFPEYINKDMEVMFTLFRKYRCGVTVAIQNLSQLEKGGKNTSYYRQTVLANTKTQIVFGDTVPEDSEYWEAAFGKEKIPDTSNAYSIDTDTGALNKKVSIEKKKKERAEAYKIQNLKFREVYYKTKDAKGKTVFGVGKTNFLDEKYKTKFPDSMFNFEKYMMSKPDDSTISINNDDSTEDDKLLETQTTSKLFEELKSTSIDNKEQNDITADDSDNKENNNDFEIEFDDVSSQPQLDTQANGGAINETYESPVIGDSSKSKKTKTKLRKKEDTNNVNSD